MTIFATLVLLTSIALASERAAVWLLTKDIKSQSLSTPPREPFAGWKAIFRPRLTRAWLVKATDAAVGSHAFERQLRLARAARVLGAAYWALTALAILAFLFLVAGP